MMGVPALVGSVLLIVFGILLLVSEAAEFVLLLQGAAAARRYRSTGFAGDALLKSPLVPGVAVITVPPDASAQSRLQVRSLLKLRSGDAEVIVVLNGVSDRERAIWTEDFRLEAAPHRSGAESVSGVYRSRDPLALVVIDRECGAYAECLNTAMSLNEAPIVAVADPFAEVSEEALLVAVERFLAGSGRTIALCAAGPVRAASGLPACLYRHEYLRCWLARCALAAWNSALPVPGSLTLFDRDAVLRLGGFRGGVLETAVRLHQMLRATGSSERIDFLPLAVAHPRIPRSWKESREARLRIRREERRTTGISKLIQYYFRPAACLALAALAIAAFGFGWVAPRLLVSLLAATLLFRVLASMTIIVLVEYAAPPAEERPFDLVAMVLAALCFWAI